MDIQKITIQVARPLGNFPGRVESGYYVVNDGEVVLVESNGVPVDRYKLTRKIPPGADARAVACNLLRERYSGSSDSFNRPLYYPKTRF